jgi:predicted lysophospholipase L1 biosynthesis ABC-type transport system permease subunit
MVVDEAFARAVWPRRDPLGQCVRLTRSPEAPAAERACMEVVGVVENAMRQALATDPAPQFFRPLAQQDIANRGLFVRSRAGGAESLIAAVRNAAQEVAADLPYAEVRTLQSHFDPQLRPWRIGVTLFIAFGGLALLVAAVGLYSIMAYSVTLRRRELGVRQALGARAGQLLALVLRDAAGVLGGGVLLGVGLSLLLGGAVRSLLFEVNPRDPLVLAGVSALLVAVGLVATLLPARRAARVEAATVLREE